MCLIIYQLMEVINGVKQIRHLSSSPLAGITRHKAAIDYALLLITFPTLCSEYLRFSVNIF